MKASLSFQNPMSVLGLLPELTCNRLLRCHCANLSGFVVDPLTQTQASLSVFKTAFLNRKETVDVEHKSSTSPQEPNFWKNLIRTVYRMSSGNSCDSLSDSPISPIRVVGPTTPRRGPPKFKQRMTRQFKSKPPKKGVRGFGDEIPGMDGLGTDITVVCPWEAFSHLELHELAQYGII
ncbi:Retinal cone rhodopsin-sensitive cGMP 3',5'-cyclic phosphodiesterase subunit gamma [Labeo rohita]|uniref:3',5'-cyclic-GMP phosphodiesterase n=2 Tax=Labeo rohita TaxID=84645 RepID=A0ABQ8MU39_LABRO|nr:Retinal cone rhodopsin-sensitive cGMP 3',5'-cyclic phosphodiesterase subunit gamma [Labeo rohita]